MGTDSALLAAYADSQDADAFAEYWEREELPFVGLPDPRHGVLKVYGQEVKLFKFGRMPAQVIVDKQGVARFVHYGHSMSDIPPNSELLDLLDSLNREEDSADDANRL